MALTVVTSGTLGPVVVGTETNIVSAQTPASPASYLLLVDMSALVATEVAFLSIYTIALAAGTEHLAYVASYIAGQDADPLQYSVPVPVDVSWRPTLLQQNGTGRSFPYKVFTL